MMKVAISASHYFRVLATLAVVALVACLLGLGEMPAAQAAFPGRIVYSGLGDYAGGIYTVWPSGGSATEVITNTEEWVNGYCCKRTGYFDPALSPDGKKIVAVKAVSYSGVPGGPAVDPEIVTIPVTGGTPTEVTNNATDDAWPSWSRNGDRIVYNGYDAQGYVEIYTISSTGGTPTKVTRTNSHPYAFEPVWSPDGTKIAYRGYDGDWEIYTVPVTGGTPTKVTDNTARDYSPSWSPNGDRVAFESDRDGNDMEIYTIPATGGTPTQFTDNQTQDSWPAFSPDGTKIVYTSDVGTQRGEGALYELLTVPSTGGIYARGSGPTVVSINNTRHNDSPDWGVATDYGEPIVANLDQNFIEHSQIAWDGRGSYHVPVSLKWSAADSDGIASYQLQQSTNDGAYQDIYQSPLTATSTILRLKLGDKSQFRVRAQDSKGNWGPWVVGNRFRAINHSDWWGTYSSSDWDTDENEEYYRGDLHYARNQRGGTATFSITGRNIGWVGTKSPSGGLAEVYVDGVYQKTVNLYSSTVQNRKVLFTHQWASIRPHTITIKLVQPSSGWEVPPKSVTVDDFMVLGY